MNSIENIFSAIGGTFATEIHLMQKKLSIIKGFIFDWDGVFNTGTKSSAFPSTYSEIDSMGINMLRFSFWLKTKKVPFVGIITGVTNQTAFDLAKRDHYNSVYFNFKEKKEALEHLTSNFNIHPSKVLFTYDDILDVSIAKSCGINVLINRYSSPLFSEFVKKNNFADYITAHTSSDNAIREVCELFIGLNENYDEVLENRISFSNLYKEYLTEISKIQSTFYHKTDKKIIDTII